MWKFKCTVLDKIVRFNRFITEKLKLVVIYSRYFILRYTEITNIRYLLVNVTGMINVRAGNISIEQRQIQRILCRNSKEHKTLPRGSLFSTRLMGLQAE